MAEGSAAAARHPRSALVLALLGALVLALAPSWGTLAAPLVSDDAAILGHVHRQDAWADWVRPQYGLTTLRFWRPLVSLVWDLQEAWTGIAPAPLRAYNLACHAAAALLLVLLAWRLGCGALGAFAAGAFGASFPEQGGTLTWIAGRTDGTCAPLSVLALAALAARRPVAAGVAAFLACAAKEMAFVLPAMAVACAWAGPAEGRRERLRGALAVTVAVGLALFWRRAAVGSWIGGYPAPPLPAGGVVRAAGNAASTWARASGASLAGALLALPLGLALGTARPRLWLAGLVCAAAGALPLASMLSQGILEATNLRVLRVSDLGLALAVAGGLAAAPTRPRWRAAVGVGLIVALVGWRAVRAFEDTHEWAEAGRVAEAEIDAARERAAREASAPEPLLGAGFPATHGGAYCLAYGVAERFRPPFPPSPRPVWPLRRMFPAGAGERDLLRLGEGRWHDPFADPWPPGLARIELVLPAEPTVPDTTLARPTLTVDERAAHEPDRSPVLEVLGSFPGASFELVLYTELGYEPVPWPAAAAESRRSLSLRQALLCTGFVSLGEALILTADLGATRAYLEVRAVGADGAVLAASEWIELVWEPDLLAHLPPR